MTFLVSFDMELSFSVVLAFAVLLFDLKASNMPMALSAVTAGIESAEIFVAVSAPYVLNVDKEIVAPEFNEADFSTSSIELSLPAEHAVMETAIANAAKNE
jgi:hypothetical protein